MLSLLIFGFASIAAGISTALLNFKYGVDGITGLTNLMQNDPSSVVVIKLLQILGSLLVFILPTLVFTYFFRFDLRFRNIRLNLVILLPMVLLFAMPMIEILIRVNQMMELPAFLAEMETWMQLQEKNAEALMRSFLTMEGYGDLAFNLFMIALIPALGEELLFRGALQQLFSKWTRNPHLGILIAAALFSAMHLQFYGFLPRMVLGMLFGYLFFYSGSLWIPIIAHMLFNGVQIVLAYSGHIDPSEFSGAPVETVPGWMLFAGIALFVLTMIYFRRIAQQTE